MLAKILKGNRNFIPIMIFILFGLGFFFLNFADFSEQDRNMSMILLILALLHTALIINHFPYFRENYYFTFLLSIAFLLIACCFGNLQFYAALFMLLIVFVHLLYSYQQEIYILNGFDLGFFLGFAIIFEPSFWIYSFYLIISFVVKGKTELRGLIITFLGLLTFAVLALEVIAVWDLWQIYDAFIEQLKFNLFEWKNEYLFLFPILIPFVLGLIDYYRNINRQSASKKLVYFDALLFLIFAVISLILYGGNNSGFFLIILIPVILLISNYLTFNRIYWQKETTIILIIISLVLYRFHQFIKLPSIFDQVTF